MSVLRLMEVCPFALCLSREKVVLKILMNIALTFSSHATLIFKSVRRAHALTLEASSVQTAMVCSQSISLTPSLPASCNALDRSLSVPTQKRDGQEITDIKVLSSLKFSFPTSSTVRQDLCVRLGCSTSAGLALSPWVVQDGTSFSDLHISLPLS